MEVKKEFSKRPTAAAEEAGTTTVPVDMGQHRKVFEIMGLSFGEPLEDDPFSLYAELPFGWSKDHIGPFWYIIDQNGRKRGMIFKKFAGSSIYQMLPLKRLSMLVGRNTNSVAYANILDGDIVLYSVKVPVPGPHDNAFEARETAERQARQWLEENFPDWEDPTAYWDQPDLMN